jgi:hypothetical protein
MWNSGFKECIYPKQSFTSHCTAWERWLLLESVDQRPAILSNSAQRSWDPGSDKYLTQYTSSGAEGDWKENSLHLYDLFLYIKILCIDTAHPSMKQTPSSMCNVNKLKTVPIKLLWYFLRFYICAFLMNSMSNFDKDL